MPTTKDYAKLGKTTWLVYIERVHYNEVTGSEVFPIKTREVASRAAAEKFLNDWMPRYAMGTTDDVQGSIISTTYIDGSFDDVTYGHVLHAVQDDNSYPRAYAHMITRDAAAPTIEWEEQ